MRGRPLLEWALFMAVWLLLLIPLRVLTSHDAAPARTVGPTAAARQPAWMTLRFSVVPSRFSIEQESTVLWEHDAPDRHFSDREVSLALHEGAADIVVKVEWPGSGVLKAVEVRLVPDELEEVSQTVWAEGDVLEEVLTFHW